LSRDFDDWSEAVSRVGNCAHPIRLCGSSDTVDTWTGEIVASYRSSDEPLGITYVGCGNRRASECLSCPRLYAADMFHLIWAGVTGGKTVPASVADHPLVFATLTAPSTCGDAVADNEIDVVIRPSWSRAHPRAPRAFRRSNPA
jgi:hypothetical protein